MERVKRKLVLENGDVYVGYGFGAQSDAIGEIVFNTSMAGYQEIISDPSYTDQILVMSYPIIGNYGITDEDYESKSLLLNTEYSLADIALAMGFADQSYYCKSFKRIVGIPPGRFRQSV